MKRDYVIATLIGLALVIAVVIAILDWVRTRKMKGYPVRYAYKLNGLKALPSMVSDERDCIEKIKKYYADQAVGAEGYVPDCPIHVIQLHDNKVHVLSVDSDCMCAEIALFYRRGDGPQKRFIGYVLMTDLHEAPYSGSE